MAKSIECDEHELRRLFAALRMRKRPPAKRYVFSCQTEQLAGLNGCEDCSKCIEVIKGVDVLNTSEPEADSG